MATNHSKKYHNLWLDFLLSLLWSASDNVIYLLGTEDIYLETPVTNEMLATTAAICRALSRRASNLLLCGPIGSGRNEALHVACSILGTKISIPTPVLNYGMTDFYNDLKAVYVFLVV